MLASPRFVDRSPAEVVATLLDEGQYLCAERTMYRILAANQPVRERRNQRSHPCYTKPELMATGPNQTWSWDITRLRGPKRWTSFYLYVLLDIFSRCVVGWMVADRENAALAATLIEETCLKQGIEPQVLTLHSDRGAPMTSKCTAQLLGGPMDRAAHPAESRRRRVRPGATEPTPRERRFSLPQDGARGPRLRTSRRQSRSIRVTWDDGIAGTFHHLWLRDNRVSNLRHEYLRLPTRDSANIAAESTTVRAEVRPRSPNPLQCGRPFLIVAGVTGWRMKH